MRLLRILVRQQLQPMGAAPYAKSCDTFDSPQLKVIVFIFNEFSRGISLARPEVDRSDRADCTSLGGAQPFIGHREELEDMLKHCIAARKHNGRVRIHI